MNFRGRFECLAPAGLLLTLVAFATGGCGDSEADQNQTGGSAGATPSSTGTTGGSNAGGNGDGGSAGSEPSLLEQVTLVDGLGRAVPAGPIIVNDSSGKLIAQVVSGDDGKIVTDVPSGGSISYIDEGHNYVVTYHDVPQGGDLRIESEHADSATQVTPWPVVVFFPQGVPAEAAKVTYQLSCASPVTVTKVSGLAGAFENYTGCGKPTFDAVTWATDLSDQVVAVGVVTDIAQGTQGVPAATLSTNLPSVSIGASNIPVDAISYHLGISGINREAGFMRQHFDATALNNHEAEFNVAAPLGVFGGFSIEHFILVDEPTSRSRARVSRADALASQTWAATSPSFADRPPDPLFGQIPIVSYQLSGNQIGDVVMVGVNQTGSDNVYRYWQHNLASKVGGAFAVPELPQEFEALRIQTLQTRIGTTNLDFDARSNYADFVANGSAYSQGYSRSYRIDTFDPP